MRFIVHDAAGNILRTGVCADAGLTLQAHAGETAIEDTWGDTSDAKHRIVNGERVDHMPPAPPAPTFDALRAQAYPPIAEQLDALWQGGAAAAAMKKQIDDVKAKYPKPN